MSLDADPLDALFNSRERTLIAQALSETPHEKGADGDEIIRARLRNLLEKYRELAKRERFQGSDNSDSALRVQWLEAILARFNLP